MVVAGLERSLSCETTFLTSCHEMVVAGLEWSRVARRLSYFSPIASRHEPWALIFIHVKPLQSDNSLYMFVLRR